MENKLTVEQRLEAYIYAWMDINVNLEEGYLNYMCCSLRDWYDKETSISWSSDYLYENNTWPELVKRKPKEYNYVWFNDLPYSKADAKRLKVLEACINDCLIQIQKSNKNHPKLKYL